MAFFSAGHNVMHISKFVVKIVFSAGLAFFLRLTENRLGYQFRFQKSLGSSRPANPGSSWQHPPKMDDAVPPTTEAVVPLVTETMISLVLETKPLVVQDTHGESNITGSSHPEVLYSAHNTSLMACIIGLSVCSLFAIIAATCIILSPSRHSIQKARPKLKAKPRSGSRWWNIVKWMWALNPRRQVPTGTNTSDGSGQSRGTSPELPGSYPVDFALGFGPPRTRDGSGNFCFVRGGMPPPPPPPPMHVEAMFENNWNDWLSFIILLPFILYVLRTTGRLLLRFMKSIMRRVSRRRAGPRLLRVFPDRPSKNPPLQVKVPKAPPAVVSSRNSTLTQDVIQSTNSQRSLPVRSQLASSIISGTRLLRKTLKILALITLLLHSCIFYMAPALIVLIMWYYLPDILLRLLSGPNPRSMVREQSQTANRPIDVDQISEESEANRTLVYTRAMHGSKSRPGKTVHTPADVPEAMGPCYVRV
ncbi:hypothetical protein JR316_0010083 [Psilocybe cubensis]|uniref:Uncharacterized protein n=1 Tax=Psilocybe cubensis TaxID=181762 RepID=A0ACB8GRK1_PSICU|nr:hypothetical protein JR316_0010083 [Psilocybe cubensis]KAH9477851.1 hypothetical protein JR316_0010083 [Psilocybe cubensis]